MILCGISLNHRQLLPWLACCMYVRCSSLTSLLCCTSRDVWEHSPLRKGTTLEDLLETQDRLSQRDRTVRQCKCASITATKWAEQMTDISDDYSSQVQVITSDEKAHVCIGTVETPNLAMRMYEAEPLAMTRVGFRRLFLGLNFK